MMGASTRGEKGVLKLVHPGRHVEVHTRPITAAEVMEKNPRHRIARPDVFKFPWIVVRPESVLFPGQVFYIVPDRTIYDLLKCKGRKNAIPSRRNQCPEDYGHHFSLEQSSTHASSAGMLPKNQNHNRCTKRDFMSDEEDSDRSDSVNSYFEAWPVMCKNRNTYLEFKYENTVDSRAENRSLCRNEKNRTRSSKVAGMDEHGKSYAGNKFHDLVSSFPSCLKKHDNARMSRNLRVTFAFPIVTRSEH